MTQKVKKCIGNFSDFIFFGRLSTDGDALGYYNLHTWREMQLTYAFIYYFLVAFIAFTFSLIVFALRPVRKLLHKFQTKFQNVLNNSFWKYTINFSFAIIFLILADSLRTFYSMNKHFQESTSTLYSDEHAIGKIGGL